MQTTLIWLHADPDASGSCSQSSPIPLTAQCRQDRRQQAAAAVAEHAEHHTGRAGEQHSAGNPQRQCRRHLPPRRRTPIHWPHPRTVRTRRATARTTPTTRRWPTSGRTAAGSDPRAPPEGELLRDHGQQGESRPSARSSDSPQVTVVAGTASRAAGTSAAMPYPIATAPRRRRPTALPRAETAGRARDRQQSADWPRPRRQARRPARPRPPHRHPG